MRAVRIAVFAGAVILMTTAPCFAAGWTLTADAPVQYSFDKGAATLPAPGNSVATWRNRTTSDVSGSKVLLIAPFHVGVGYEDYSITQKVDYVSGGGGPGVARVTSNLRIYDVALDFPTGFLNWTLGAGSGSANTDIVSLTAGGGAPNPIRNASLTQVFLTVGIPLGANLDLHAGYHWVSIENKDLINAGQPNHDKFQESGEMLSAGLRLNF